MRKWYLSVVGLTLVFGCTLLFGYVSGEDTFASNPSYSSSDDHFYEDLYFTDFFSINDLEIFTPNPPWISVQNNALQIQGSVFDQNYVKTRRIDFDANNFLYNGNSYEVRFRFKALNVVQGNFKLFNNGEIDLQITDNQGTTWVIANQYGVPMQLLIAPIQKGQWYFFTITAFHTGQYTRYNVKIDLATTTNVRYTAAAVTSKVSLGDTMIGGTGGGQWDNFLLRGLSKAQYFNNFDDDLAHEFRFIDYDDERVDLLVLEDALYLDTYLSSGPPALHKDGYIYTEYMNYEPTETWRISLDFKIDSSNNNDFVLVSNRQATIWIDGTNLDYYDGTDNFVMNLQTGVWYLLELEKTSDSQYRILVDNDVKAAGCQFDDQGPSPVWWDFLGIGDWSPTVYGDGVSIDNLKLIVETRTHADGDGDGLGDVFEEGDTEPKLYVWSTDFEDKIVSGYRRPLELGELGWEFTPVDDDPDGYESNWEKGEPAYPEGPAKGHADGIFPSNGKCLGTNLEGEYWRDLTEGEGIKTPWISLENVRGHATLTLWHWYDFEEGDDFPDPADDGGQIYIFVGGEPIPTLLGEYQDPYTATGHIASPDPCFSGSSDGWEYLEFDLTNYVGLDIRIFFHFRADSDQNLGAGWYIDDIKIFGNLDSADPDNDHDNLEDGEEFHTFCTSFFRQDTDRDSLMDDDEVEKNVLADYAYYIDSDTNSWSDPLTKDIWVEVDEMDDVDAGCEWDSTIRIMVEGDFIEHAIRVHFIYSEEIDGLDDIDTDGLEGIGALKTNEGEREDENDGFYHYLLWAQTCIEPDESSYAYGSHWFMAVFANHEDLDSDAKRANEIEHALGRNLGLWHYDQYYKDATDENPPPTSMKRAIGTWRDYLGDESDFIYYWDDGENDPECRWLGGWDYSHTSLSTFKRGLDYSGIDEDETFQQTGWAYSP